MKQNGKIPSIKVVFNEQLPWLLKKKDACNWNLNFQTFMQFIFINAKIIRWYINCCTKPTNTKNPTKNPNNKIAFSCTNLGNCGFFP